MGMKNIFVRLFKIQFNEFYYIIVKSLILIMFFLTKTRIKTCKIMFFYSISSFFSCFYKIFSNLGCASLQNIVETSHKH